MKRKPALITIALTLCLLAVGIAAACSGTSGGGQGAGDQGEAAQGSTKGLEKLAIIHTNDTHGYARAAEGCLGMAAIRTIASWRPRHGPSRFSVCSTMKP